MLPLALLDLEEYDETIAAITNSPPPSRNSTNLDVCRVHENHHIASRSPDSQIGCETKVARIRRDDLERISLIGRGRFSNVHLSAGPYRANNDINKSKSPTLVAVKSINSTRIKSALDLTIAAGELANEATILSELDHENIIELRGVCSETFSASFGCGGFFLVFEVLQETLCDRLQKWRREKQKMQRIYRKASKGLHFFSSFLSKTFPKYHGTSIIVESSEFEPTIDERKRRLYYRIKETVLGITNGMEYLHSRKIALRDLKPANIGYQDNCSVRYGTSSLDASLHTRSGSTVRLFDFGMAGRIENCDPLETCGSLRYMAPEVMTGMGYSLMVDVYSFGVVLFEICSLCHPFHNNTKPTWIQRQRRMLRKIAQAPSRSKKKTNGESSLLEDYRKRFLAGEVVLANNMEKSVFCPELRSLIEKCCSSDPLMRPTFPEIQSRLDHLFDE